MAVKSLYLVAFNGYIMYYKQIYYFMEIAKYFSYSIGFTTECYDMANLINDILTSILL